MINLLSESHIIVLGLLLLGGFLAGKLIQVLKLPSITGYVLAGILMGYSAMNIIQKPMLPHLRFIEVLGLSMVALIIGSDLNNKKLKQLGKSVVIITIVQVAGAFFVVTLGTMWLLKMPLHTALILGAIGSATAPAATVAVIHEYKASGPLTDTLMAVVALDDAVCVILFSITIAISGVLLNEGSAGLFWTRFGKSLWEISGSIGFGALLGYVVTFILRTVREKHEVVVLLLGVAFLAGEVGEFFGLSSLLLNMTYGYMLTNFGHRTHIPTLLEDVELPVLICFFTLAGATLDLTILLKNWLAAMVFIIARAIGKVLGAYAGGKMGHAQEAIVKYLGFAMLPQAGVAIALVLVVGEELPQTAPLITALVLASVTFNEIFGPLGTKIAIIASGEDGRKQKLPSHSSMG